MKRSASPAPSRSRPSSPCVSPRAAYQRAAALYPMSQAPHLALSLLAREAGERQTAQFALGNFLFAPTPDRVRYDPWWVYFWGSGRDMRGLVLRMWAECPGAATS